MSITSTSAGTSALLDGPTSGHSTPASYTSSSHPHPSTTRPHTHGTSTPTSQASIDLSNLTSYPAFTAMFADPDLPIANISRIMKCSLPDNAKIAKDAKECVQDCVSEFISFITSEASDKCAVEKRKTINGDDILYALRVLGFDNYEEVLRVQLSRYRMDQENNPKARKRSAGGNARPNGEEDEEDEDEEDEEDAGNSNVGSGVNSPSLLNHHSSAL